MLIVKERVSDGLVLCNHMVFGEPFLDLWTKCNARKYSICEISGKEIKPGDKIYRPITNGSNRMYRALAEAVEVGADKALPVEPATGGSMNFDVWHEQLSSLAGKKGISVADKDAWRESYDRSLAPWDALVEEYGVEELGDLTINPSDCSLK